MAGVLRSIELFAGLEDDVLDALAQRAEHVGLLSGEVLLRQGEVGDSLSVVRSGRLRVTTDGPDGERLVGFVGRGEVVGEMALLSDEPRTATVRADRDCELVRLPMAAFDEIVASHPPVLRRVATQVVARMRRSLEAPVATAGRSTVCVLALSSTRSAEVAAGELVVQLEAAVPGATRASRARASTDLGLDDLDPDGRDREDVAAWAAELEERHPMVLLCTDPEDEAWSHRCIRQADVVVAVVDAGDPGSSPLDEAIASQRAAVATRVELVVVRPWWAEDARGTSALLRTREVDAHHHVRAGEAGDLARVARLISGQGHALVLSGGGARGIAHLGVLRALAELAIPVDAVAGTSIGALVAGAVARGWGWERVQAVLRDGLAERRVLDPTLPLVSLTAGRRVTSRLREAGDGLDIEDLHLDYFCVSTNLSRKSAVVHRSGPAWRAIRASIAIPGLFPPVPDGDDVLVDGGLLDNLPVGRMRTAHPGSVVTSVDVGARHDLSAAGLSEACEASAWGSARSRLRGGREADAVTLARVLVSLTEIGSAAGTAEEADVVVAPDVQDLPILDFSRFDEFVVRGYEAALEALEGHPWLGRGGT